MANTSPQRRRIAFVTGTRAEFGLMVSTLRAIQAHPNLHLQLVATGMHLDRAHGRSIDTLRRDGWHVDAVVPWPRASSPADTARRTGQAIARLAGAFEQLDPDIVLVVGDRVEAFAAASAAHISGRLVAHVHGGDRALGQVDDALRHAITKLAHIHFPATADSARRLLRLGEDRRRIFCVGTPGLDGIRQLALPRRELQRMGITPGRFALIVLHPVTPDAQAEYRHADIVLAAALEAGFDQLVCIHPNNDPGNAGIARRLDEFSRDAAHSRHIILRDAPRPLFLALMRDAAVMLGNSSAGIIEAASFSTPVLDIGPRQQGRLRSANVTHVPCDRRAIAGALKRIWRSGSPVRKPVRNVYGAGGTGRRIAAILGRLTVTDALRRKLITY